MADNLYSSYASPATVNDILTSTANAVSKGIKDNYFNEYVLLNWFKNNAMEKVDGGAHIVERLEYAANQTPSFVNGNDVIDTKQNTTLTEAFYKGKILAGSCTISDDELSENTGKAQLTSLITHREQNLRKSMARIAAQALWTFSPETEAPNSLLEILSSSDPARGNLGQIDRDTYTWWQSNQETMGSFATNGLSAIGSFLRTIAPNKGMDTPKLAATTSAIFGYLEAELQDQVRFTDDDMARAGFKNLRFNDTVFTYDEFAASGKIAYLNPEYIKMKVYSSMDWKSTPYTKPYDQLNRTKQVVVKYNITTNNPRKLGLHEGVTE